MTTEPGAPEEQSHPPAVPDKRESDAILPFGVGERLDEIAQDRFNRSDWIELAAVGGVTALIGSFWGASGLYLNLTRAMERLFPGE